MAEKIKQDIYWIGVDNPKNKDFHGISTPRGGSYNSYLIIDDKTTIVEATNKPFFEEYIKSLKSVIDPKKIEFIIVDHAEPDHAGAIKELIGECINAKIVCTEKCREFLIEASGIGCEFLCVKENDTLKIGRRTFRFFMDPMVHWPETMLSYLIEEKMLFSGDLFGTEISHEKLFADDIEAFQELTRDYFAIVMRPFAIMVKKAIDKVRKLEMKYILPSHGPVYRKDINTIVDYYDKLASNPEEEKILVVYSSIWKSTEQMALEIEKGIKSAGYNVVRYNIANSNFVRLMAEAMTSRGIAFGSLTIIGTYHPLFETLFTFLKLNNQKGKKAIVFESYGWSPVAARKLKTKLVELEYDVIGSLEVRFSAGEEDIKKLNDLGKKLVEVAKNG